MSALGALFAILAGYLAYQWGSGHREQPNPIVFVLVMALSLIVTVPAYYIGRHNREVK